MTAPTAAQWRWLERRVAHWQRILRLDAWRITVEREPTDQNGANAHVWRANQYPLARIYFREDWPTGSERNLDETIVHELLHLVTRDVDVAALDHVRDHLAPGVAAMHADAYRQANEGAIEHLAWTIVALADSR